MICEFILAYNYLVVIVDRQQMIGEDEFREVCHSQSSKMAMQDAALAVIACDLML